MWIPLLTDTQDLIGRVQTLHREIAERQRELLEVLAQLETRQAWVEDGAHDMAQWTSMALDVSRWKADRLLGAGRALPRCPPPPTRSRVATSASTRSSSSPGSPPSTMKTRSCVGPKGSPRARLRRAGDLQVAHRDEQAAEAERTRWLQWKVADEGQRFVIDGELPSAQGAVVAKALDRLGDRSRSCPGRSPTGSWAAAGPTRSSRCAPPASPVMRIQDRATIVVHADIDVLEGVDANALIEDGPVDRRLHGAAAVCNARVQMVLERPDGTVAGVGRLAREPSAWMMRQLRHRDDACRFPGCDARRFTQAHHIEWWSRGGTTDLDNLILVCSFHHKLVHEHGW